MGNRRLALIVGASLCFAGSALAQPEGEIEMEGDAPPPADPPPETPPVDQPVQKDPKVARTWVKAAEQLMKKGDQLTRQNKLPEAKTQYENAVTAYSKAIEAGDDVSLNYQLALAEDKAGLTPEAMKHLKIVLAAQGIKPDIMKKAQTKLDDFSMKVGVVALSITPEGTQVSLAGKVIGEAPLGEPLVLMPGLHKVSFTAVGFQPKDVDLKIEAGSESERKIALEPVPIVNKPEGPEEPVPEKPVETPKGPDMRPLYIGAGATGGFLLIATITGIVAVGKHGTYTDATVPASERADAQSSGKTFAMVTDLCIVGALGAAAFTAYWYQYKYRPQAKAFAERNEAPPTEAKVDVVPWVQPGDRSFGGGLSVAGQF